MDVWLTDLAEWIEANGLCGYDPFDVKQHPWIRATQPCRWPRRATTVLCDLFPVTMRRLLGIQPTENAKAHALVALGHLRLCEVSHDMGSLERAEASLRWLVQNSVRGYGGLCWGYPFDVFAKGLDTPRGTPIGVVGAIAGEAFALAHGLTNKGEYLEASQSIAEFFLRDLPRMLQEDGTVCFGYTPRDHRRVHNANLHVAAHLYRMFHLTGDGRVLKEAEPALHFTLSRQRGDGSWPYGEWDASEPFERGLMSIVDHHHTGFVLRSLHEIHGITKDEALATAIQRGYAFYRERLFDSDGAPITAYARYPIDIHACAEAILCPSVLSSFIPETFDLAGQSLSWTYRRMRDPRTHLPYYRRYPWLVSHVVFPRWGVAWMFYALCEYAVAASRRRTATISGDVH